MRGQSNQGQAAAMVGSRTAQKGGKRDEDCPGISHQHGILEMFVHYRVHSVTVSLLVDPPSFYTAFIGPKNNKARLVPSGKHAYTLAYMGEGFLPP